MRVRMMMMAALAACVLCGCEVRQAQVAVRTALTSADEGLTATDRIVAGPMQERSEEVLSGIRESCPPGEPCPGAVDRYREGMGSWLDVPRALRAAHDALLAADEALEVWIASGGLPGWGNLCASASEALRRLLTAVSSAMGEDVPQALSAAPGLVAGACTAVQVFVPGGGS